MAVTTDWMMVVMKVDCWDLMMVVTLAVMMAVMMVVLMVGE